VPYEVSQATAASSAVRQVWSGGTSRQRVTLSAPYKVRQPLDCVIICREKSGKTAVQLCQRALVEIVWISSQEHRYYESVRLCHLFLWALQWTGAVRKRSAETEVVEWHHWHHWENREVRLRDCL